MATQRGGGRGSAATAAVDATAADDAADRDARWRERSIERSLRTARERAGSRSDRFILAANQLLLETGRTDFTVQEIVERSKMSLRSFYQHFASKDELLLALFEELIREWVARLRITVYESTDPVEQLRCYVVGMFSAASSVEVSAPSRALSIYHLRLAETHPREFSHALSPQIELLMEILGAGAEAGTFRSDISTEQVAIILTQTLLATVHMSVLGANWAETAVNADDLWEFCRAAVVRPEATADGSAIVAARSRRR